MLHRPHQRHLLAGRAVQWQPGHHIAVDEPLPRHAIVGLLATQARRHRGVRVGPGVELEAKGRAAAAALAFADHRQRSGRGFVDHGDAALEAHRVGQPLFQRRHVDDPGQRLAAVGRGVKVQALQVPVFATRRRSRASIRASAWATTPPPRTQTSNFLFIGRF